MDLKLLKFCQDILNSIAYIESFIGEPRLYDTYDKSELIQSAVERHLEIIGEAMKHILEILPGADITNARKIVNTRNKISHGYDEIDNSEIWNIIINHLPILKGEIKAIMKL